jgi:hypothetical protein
MILDLLACVGHFGKGDAPSPVALHGDARSENHTAPDETARHRVSSALCLAVQSLDRDSTMRRAHLRKRWRGLVN